MTETITSVDPNMHVATLQEDGRLRPYLVEPGEAAYLQEKLAEQRADLEALPSDEEGLNVTAVRGFLEGYGLEVSPHKIVSLKDADVDSLELESSHLGVYDVGADIAVVLRDAELDASNGAVYSESTLAHELAHSSGRERHAIIVLDESDDLPIKGGRVGFQTMNPRTGIERGAFIEEGFAEVFSGRYVSKATGSPNGVWGGDVSRNREFSDDTGRTFELAERYLFKNPNAPSEVVCGVAAVAAEGLDVLIRVNPDLLDAMITARSGGAEEIRKMVQTFNSIAPGLYKRLWNASYTLEGFAETLAEIRIIEQTVSAQKVRVGAAATSIAINGHK